MEVLRAIDMGASSSRSAKAAIDCSVEQRPIDQELLHPGVGPFIVGDGDAAVGSTQDRLDDHRIAERHYVALALQLGLVGIDAAGDVDAERQREIDVLLVLRLVWRLLLGHRRQGQQDKAEQVNENTHDRSPRRCPAATQKAYRPPDGAARRRRLAAVRSSGCTSPSARWPWPSRFPPCGRSVP